MTHQIFDSLVLNILVLLKEQVSKSVPQTMHDNLFSFGFFVDYFKPVRLLFWIEVLTIYPLENKR